MTCQAANKYIKRLLSLNLHGAIKVFPQVWKVWTYGSQTVFHDILEGWSQLTGAPQFIRQTEQWSVVEHCGKHRRGAAHRLNTGLHPAPHSDVLCWWNWVFSSYSDKKQALCKKQCGGRKTNVEQGTRVVMPIWCEGLRSGTVPHRYTHLLVIRIIWE